ncbi:outer membrane beta-barrel protein [Shewanella youngdeokensis]|uniref:Outer membrane beta-barrel protein n=1 Tax=Shewanella youngdeokensis TaxID=2999068 RepID=A0ABZ0K3I7_9GAMM|nr:outer membrane beta-barrel protein [Shewanella sp. DAU334]
MNIFKLSLWAMTFSSGLVHAYESKVYVGVELGRTLVSSNESSMFTDEEDMSKSIYAGYQLQPWLSFQIGLLDGGDYFKESSTDYAINGIELSLKPSFELSPSWLVYGKVGVLAYDVDDEVFGHDRSLSSGLGFGVEHRINPNWSVNIAGQYYGQIGDEKPTEVDLTAVSLGVIYRFVAQERKRVPRQEKRVSRPINRETQAVKTNDVKPIHQQPKDVTLTETIFFNNDEFIANAEQLGKLVKLYEAAQDFKALKVSISGYASSVGSEQYNMQLSQRRAQFIANEIRHKLPVPITNIDIEFFGELRANENLGMDNDERAQRRVMIRMTPVNTKNH